MHALEQAINEGESMEQRNQDKTATAPVMMFVVQLLTWVVIAIVSFIGKGALTDLNDLRRRIDVSDNRLTAIEVSRFSNGDGMKLYQELGEIKTAIARIETTLKYQGKP